METSNLICCILYIVVARNLCWGPDSRGAVDAEIEHEGGVPCPLPSQLRVLEERHKLPGYYLDGWPSVGGGDHLGI